MGRWHEVAQSGGARRRRLAGRGRSSNAANHSHTTHQGDMKNPQHRKSLWPDGAVWGPMKLVALCTSVAVLQDSFQTRAIPITHSGGYGL